MPDAGELPRVLRTVVPLVGAGDTVVDELIPDRIPRPSAVVGALHRLAEPSAGLRGIKPVRVDRRALQVIHLPAREVGTADVPPFALLIRCQYERTLARTNQNPHATHPRLLSEPPETISCGTRHLVDRLWLNSTTRAYQFSGSPDFGLAGRDRRALRDASGEFWPAGTRTEVYRKIGVRTGQMFFDANSAVAPL